jgi:hypothetical protein
MIMVHDHGVCDSSALKQAWPGSLMYILYDRGWAEPYTHTVYDRMYDNYYAKKIV